ncbi:hypothetical protein ACLOJK_029348 [Asimina triloba]
MASASTSFMELRPRPKIPPIRPLFSPPLISRSNHRLQKHHQTVRCAPNPSNPTPQNAAAETQNKTEVSSLPNTELEKQQKSEFLKKARTSKLDRPEPPNFEIGWKRTKEIKTEKPKGYVIMDFLDKLEGLMTRRQYGSANLLAKVGEIVSERAMEEAEVLREEGEVEDRRVTELGRVLRLMQMDLEMVKAAVKEETLNERLEQAKARCRQAILVANSF